MRTARSRISGEYLFDVFIAPSSQRLESPVKPGRFKHPFVNSQIVNLADKFYGVSCPDAGASAETEVFDTLDIHHGRNR